MVGLLAIFAIGLFVDAGRLLTLDNIFRVAQSAAIVSMVGYGMALLMVTGEFDLSVGSLYALSGALTAIMLAELGYGPVFTMILVMTFAVLFGISQGLVVTKLGLPSLIVTIGTLTFVRGAHLLLLGGTTATKHPTDGGIIMEALGGSIQLPAGWQLTYQLPVIHESAHTWNSFPVQVVWIFVLLAVFHYVLFYTKFGYHVRATGDNINSVDTTGVDAEIIKIGAFGVSALMASFAGISQLARINSASGGTGDGLALIVIAAVVLGGTKLDGGEGSMVGVLLGALILALAQNILTIAGFGAGGWQSVITGLFIIAAIGLDTVFKGFTVDLIGNLYTGPLREIAGSAREFFRVKAPRKTSDDMIGFLMLSFGLTVFLMAIGTALVGLVSPIVGLADLLTFDLLVGEGLILASIMTYLIFMLLTVLAVVTLEVTTRNSERAGDYETSLAVVCYGMAPVVLMAIPLLLLGYSIAFVGTPIFTAMLVSLPIVALIVWTMHAGVVELHEIHGRQALGSVLSVALVWILATLWVAINVV